MRTVRIRRYRDGRWEEREDIVAEEVFLEVVVGEHPLGVLACTPSQIPELIHGHLAGLGLIGSAHEVQDYREEWDFSQGIPGERVRVRVQLQKVGRVWPQEGVVWSSCRGSSAEDRGLPHLLSHPIFSPAALLPLPQRVLALAEGFQKTGAQHSAALFDRNLEVLAFAEDIGRHNAVDKVIGAALLTQKPLGEALLYTTGRVGSELVVKTLRLGIPVLACPGAPLWGAVALARHHNLGLIGFLRGRRFNLYSGEGWFTS